MWWGKVCAFPPPPHLHYTNVCKTSQLWGAISSLLLVTNHFQTWKGALSSGVDRLSLTSCPCQKWKKIVGGSVSHLYCPISLSTLPSIESFILYCLSWSRPRSSFFLLCCLSFQTLFADRFLVLNLALQGTHAHTAAIVTRFDCAWKPPFWISGQKDFTNRLVYGLL